MISTPYSTGVGSTPTTYLPLDDIPVPILLQLVLIMVNFFSACALNVPSRTHSAKSKPFFILYYFIWLTHKQKYMTDCRKTNRVISNSRIWC